MAVPKGISVEGPFQFCACFKQFSPYYHISRVNIFYEKLLNSITCCRRAFPIDIGISVPETMVSPIIAPLGCKIYLFSPSP
ncbi:hypothetical protein LUZ60_018510 [Juncus effusus]|nr:hypothetical protein LUZ60_018510 [Juncus effusus]